MIRWAVSRPAVVWAITCVILLGGAVSFSRLALATATEVELPRLQIAASWPGASSELVEMYLASPVEAAVQSVKDVRKTSSESRDGSARLTVELDPAANVQLTRLAILERLELLRPTYPIGVVPPRVSNFVPEELSEAPLLRVLLSGPYTPGAMQRIADQQLTPRISAVPGVAGVSVGGGTEFGATVSYDASLLRQLGISPDLIGEAIRNARVVTALGTERIGASKREVVLRDQPGGDRGARRPPHPRARQPRLPSGRPRARAAGGGFARDVLPCERQHRARLHRHARAEQRRDRDGEGRA
jgi:multidrug efflux pump subunit AcrB